MSNICIFEKGDLNVGSFGSGVLKDWVTAPKVKRQNEQYEFEGVYRADGANAHLLLKGNEIECTADGRNKKQRFDIVRAVKVNAKHIQVYARHVGHRTKYLDLLPVVKIKGNGIDALTQWKNSLVGNHQFTVWSDITDTIETEFTIDKISNAREALFQIAKLFRADIEFDNHKILLSRNLGKQSPIVLSYGKNITDFELDESDDEVYTSIYPYVKYDNQIYTLDGNERIVDSPYSNFYTYSRVLKVDFSDEFKDNAFDGGDAGENSTESAGEGAIESHEGEEGGIWKRNNTGWWYEYSDGSYLRNCWKKLGTTWYRFKKNGYMYESEWFRDQHGNRYYFDSSGAMVTGWHLIKGKWKYFYETGSLDKDRKKPYELDKVKLKSLSEKYIKDNNIGLPHTIVKVSYVELMEQNTKTKETVCQFDSVKMRFPQLDNALSNAKVSGTEWLPLSDTYETITIGNTETVLGTLTGKTESKLNQLQTELKEQASKIRENEKLLFSDDSTSNVNYSAETVNESNPSGFNKDDLLIKDDKIQRWTGSEWKDVEVSGDVDVSHITMSIADINTQMKVMQQEAEAKASLSVVSELKRAYDAYVDKENKDKAKAEADIIRIFQRLEYLTHNVGNMAVTYKFIDQNIRLVNEGISVGNAVGDSYILVSNNRISMFSSGKEVMYISQGVLHIDNGVFTKSIQIGYYIQTQLESNPKINVIRYIGSR